MADWVRRGALQRPRETLASLLGVKASPQRDGLIALFFSAVAESDSSLAEALLPATMTGQQQLDWVGAVIAAAGRAQDTEKVARLLNEKFPGTTRAQAAVRAVGDLLAQNPSVEEIVTFHGLLKEGEARDGTAARVVAHLAATDPQAAVRFYEGLDRAEGRTAAAESVAGRTVSDILAQLSVATEPALRSRLATALGGQLKLERRAMTDIPGSAGVDSMEIELGMLSASAGGPGGRATDWEFIEEFATGATTEGARDQAALMVANRAFEGDPAASLSPLIASGVAARNPLAWAGLVSRWLQADSAAASAWVLTVDDAGARRTAALEVARYLEGAGQKEDATVWRRHAGEAAREE